ncbi:hypothetical protein B484DRAFT_458351 [Ochromonadaceae sp. CCMP2298]|nr:hypothetical protein B484DRAFT_458351 [Ochromonadaceae sp. CCMP2298]
MSDWFGKAGIAWHGGWVYWFEEDIMVCYFYHQIVANSTTENTFTTIQLIDCVMQEHKRKFTQHTDLCLRTDAGACYGGAEMAARLPYLNNWRILSHKTGESGGNKGPGDARFGSSKKNLDRTLLSQMGRTDIDGPMALVMTLNMRLTQAEAAYLF